MKYIIFIAEMIAIILWLIFFTKSWLSGIIGIVVIVIISQLLHTLLKAR